MTLVTIDTDIIVLMILVILLLFTFLIDDQRKIKSLKQELAQKTEAKKEIKTP